jgi:hypothetical protein
MIECTFCHNERFVQYVHTPKQRQVVIDQVQRQGNHLLASLLAMRTDMAAMLACPVCGGDD